MALLKKVCLLFICLFFCRQAFEQAYIAAAKLKTIDSVFTSVFKKDLPGASAGIYYDDKVIFKNSYGVANITNKESLSSTSNFNICSLTKQFTALAILQLQQKHLLSLDDAISHFFPNMNKHVAAEITVRELLTHSSGIIDHYDYVNTAHMQHAYDSDVYNAIKNVDSTYFIPGTKFRYSNTAYCLLALIIEKLSGMPYNDYLQQKIFIPAGMKHTIVWNESATISNEVTGYSFDSATNSFKQSGAGEHIFFSTEGDGGIYTSADDYIKWFAALQSGKIFSKDIIDAARSIQHLIDSSKKVGYGFGWFVDEQQAAKMVYHSGDNGGFRTYTFTIPRENFLVVIFANRDDINIENIVQQIVKLLLPQYAGFIPIEVMTS